jgi:hypothetical protein
VKRLTTSESAWRDPGAVLCLCILLASGTHGHGAASVLRTISQNSTATPDISVTVVPVTGTRAYAMEDALPNGLSPQNISDGGMWDSARQKVKWGPFFDDTARTLTYELTGPDGTYNLSAGSGSFDGTGGAATGDSRAIIGGGAGESTALRTITQNGTPTPDVSLSITPNAGVSAYAVEDTLPAGLTPQNVGQSGTWDAVSRRVKWGPFFDSTPRTFTYEISGPGGLYMLTGPGSFDGTFILTRGDSAATIAGELGLQHIERTQDGIVLQWSTSPGDQFTLEGTRDLQVSFQPIESNITINSWTVTVHRAEPKYFYRVKTEP